MAGGALEDRHRQEREGRWCIPGLANGKSKGMKQQVRCVRTRTRERVNVPAGIGDMIRSLVWLEMIAYWREEQKATLKSLKN